MDDLLNWGCSKGATFDVVTKRDQPRKFFAARDIAPGDVVFSLPTDMLMHGGLALTDPAYGAAFKALLAELGPNGCDQRMLLVLLLLLERAKQADSTWAPYINILPAEYDDPFWWRDEELQLLQGTRLLQAVQKYNRDLQQLHTWINRVEQLYQQQQQQQHGHEQQQHGQQQSGGPKPGLLSTALGGWGLTLDAIRWARSAVWSRAFTIRGIKQQGDSSQAQQNAAAAAVDAGAGSSVIALVPVLDMCDHHPEQRVCWRVVEGHTQQEQQQRQQQQQQQQQRQIFQFTTLKPVHQGDELFNNYGTTKPNEELLLGFGFALDPNPHDSFLVSISNRAAAAAAAAAAVPEALNGTNQHSNEAECEDAATWQQRIAIMAAAGLCLEVPITLDDPVPQQLLDVLLIATAMPAWRLSGLQGEVTELTLQQQQQQQRQESHATKALDSSGQHQQTVTMDDAEQQQQQQQQLVSGSRNCLGLFTAAAVDQQLKALLQLKQQLTAKLQGMVPAQQLQHLLLLPSTQQQQQQQQCAGSSPHHARLAAVHVLSQQQLLRQALNAVQAAVHDCLTAAAAAAFTPKHCDADAVGVRPLHSGQGPCTQDGMQFGLGFSWCQDCKTLATASTVPAGSTVLQVPLHSCLTAADEQQLIVKLMLAAVGGLKTHTCQQQQQQQYWADCWQQQQVLPWWLQQQQELVAILQDTPAGQLLLEASEELQGEFQTALQSTAAATQQQQQHHQQQLLHVFQQDQAACYKLFCWASRLVQQGASHMQWDKSQQQQQQQQEEQQRQRQQQQQLVLVPMLEHVPKAVRALAFEVSVSANQHSKPQQQQQQQQMVTVTTACALPAQLHFTSNIITSSNVTCQQLLIDHGPAAVAAAAATGPLLRHVYDLVVCPSEDDALRDHKLQLLAATGLGLTHYLTLLPAQNTSLQQQQQQQQLENVLAAMSVALCDHEQLLPLTLIQQIAEQQQQLLASVRGDPPSAAAAAAVDVTTTTAAAADTGRTMIPADAAGAAWGRLKAQLLRQYSKACRKQLIQVLKTDLQAVQQAVQQLAGLQAVQQHETVASATAPGAAAVKGSVGQPQQLIAQICSSCGCHNSSNSSSSNSLSKHPAGKAAAVTGLHEYLTGLEAVLKAWIQQVKAYASSSSSSGKPASCKHSAGDVAGGKKQIKKQKQK